MTEKFRTEHDALGSLQLPADVLYGIHTARALQNFPISQRPVHDQLVRSFGLVKLACLTTNRQLGWWADAADKADAMEQACQEMTEGLLTEWIRVDALQGGAGTSTNMNVNEVLANRALQLLNEAPGTYDRISPLGDLNLHQSTNDTYPTALKLAAIVLLHKLENSLVALQEAFQEAEKRFSHVVKIGRTQLQDAVLTTLGRSMSAYAETLGRDRWRIYKCEERLRVVNLGGTAIGTGLAAPRNFVFSVVDQLRELTGLGLARAENLIEATQNTDVFVEVSGLCKTCASNLLKISTDLRLMASGPEAGFGEINLPERQAGSSIMPGKVNPVIPEAVSQAAMLTFGHDSTLTLACASGNLELNAFLPLVAHCLLESIDVLTAGCNVLREFCVEGITADETRCEKHVRSSTATVTALLPLLGYERAGEVARIAMTSGQTIRDIVIENHWLTAAQFDELVSPEAVCRLGMPDLGRGETSDRAGGGRP